MSTASRRAGGRLQHCLIAPVLVSFALLGVACAAEEAATEAEDAAATNISVKNGSASEYVPNGAQAQAVCVSRGEEDNRPLLQLVVAVCEAEEYRTVLEQVQMECESRIGHTELLLSNSLHTCYTINSERRRLALVPNDRATSSGYSTSELAGLVRTIPLFLWEHP